MVFLSNAAFDARAPRPAGRSAVSVFSEVALAPDRPEARSIVGILVHPHDLQRTLSTDSDVTQKAAPGLKTAHPVRTVNDSARRASRGDQCLQPHPGSPQPPSPCA